MHCTRTHWKYARDTEGVLYELGNIFEENKYHPHDCVRPDHKDSKVLGQKIKKREVWEGHIYTKQ